MGVLCKSRRIHAKSKLKFLQRTPFLIKQNMRQKFNDPPLVHISRILIPGSVYYSPSERHRRNSSARTDLPRERTVGAKNMHSSSGCAIIRSILPVTPFREDPAAAFTRSHETAAVSRTARRARHTSINIPLACLLLALPLPANARMKFSVIAIARNPRIGAQAYASPPRRR